MIGGVNLVDYIDLGVLAVDLDERIVLWNNWLATRSGIQPDAAIGQTLHDLFPNMCGRSGTNRLTTCLHERASLVLSPTLHQYLIPLRPTAGQVEQGVEWMLQSVKGQVVDDQDGTRMVIFVTDVTERSILSRKIQDSFDEVNLKNQQLEAARQIIEEKIAEIEAKSQHKSQFLANMSHELRTPLNSIMLLSELLSDNDDGNLTEEQTEFARIIRNEGENLLLLINDVLDLAKVEAGMMTVNWAEIAVTGFVEKLCNDFGPMARQKGLALNFSVDADAPKRIRTDEDRLNQVLRNLVVNAIKFTSTGSVSISAHSAQDGRLSLEVADTGIGICSTQQAMIFEAFKQADGSTSRDYGGTGLGLSISQELIHLLGGEIVLESAVGEGSRFLIHLPLDGQGVHGAGSGTRAKAVTKVTDERPNTAFEEDRLLVGKIVLLVDDDMRNVFAIWRVLEKWGMRVETCNNGKDAVEYVEREGVSDLILMDLMMPVMDGLEATRQIRQRPDAKHALIVMLTAAAMQEDRKRCLAAGADGYLSKPVNIGELRELIVRLLVEQQATAQPVG